MAVKKKVESAEKILHRKMLALWERSQSPYCEVRGSAIHGRGVYATCFIPKETKIIEYVGELIDKTESESRGISQHEKSLKTGDAAVYIFTLSKKYDIDGNVPWNTARLINHSCSPNCEAWIHGKKIFTLSNKYDLDGNVPWNTARLINHSCSPNCEAWIDGRKIFIHSTTDIQAGDELTFDYGFDVDCYKDHPCLCGRDGCVGYIVGRAQWPELQARLQKES